MFRRICYCFLLLVLLLVTPGIGETASIVVQPTPQLPQVVVRENFVQIATAKIKETLEANGEQRRYEIEAVTVPAGLRLPPGRITYEPFFPVGMRFGKPMQVRIDVMIDGKKYTQIRCSMRLHVYEQVVTAARQLQPEQLLTRDDLRIEEREDDGSVMKRYTSIDQLLGKVVSRVTPQGTIINSGIVKNPVVIKAYTKVYISADINGVQVATEGMAMENGRLGMYIGVKNVTTGRIVRGKVIDQQHVLVE